MFQRWDMLVPWRVILFYQQCPSYGEQMLLLSTPAAGSGRKGAWEGPL